jgi:tetratricopeptide (TPR) repeat protein
MKRLNLPLLLAASAIAALAQQSAGYRLALPDHNGQLKWSIEGFKIVQNSAKPNGRELGVRGSDASAQLTFLGFLFLVPESAPMTSASCRDAAIAQDKKTDPTLTLGRTSEISRLAGSPVALAAYTTTNREGSTRHILRGFIAAGDLCGDLAFFSGKSILDVDLTKVFQTFELDASYKPQFSDVVLYAQVLYQTHQYQAAAPMFEKAMAIVPDDGAPFKSALIARRIVRDQEGMSYGIAGDFMKARRIFEKGVADDPDYPMSYYNLACADAGEKKLSEARIHLQQAFDRKSNMIPGEPMPVPTDDDSFLPYKNDKEFWAFLERVAVNKVDVSQ